MRSSFWDIDKGKITNIDRTSYLYTAFNCFSVAFFFLIIKHIFQHFFEILNFGHPLGVVQAVQFIGKNLNHMYSLYFGHFAVLLVGSGRRMKIQKPDFTNLNNVLYTVYTVHCTAVCFEPDLERSFLPYNSSRVTLHVW